MKEKVIIKVQDLDWFKENGYKDHDGDYHSTEGSRDYYDKWHDYGNTLQNDKTIYFQYAGTIREVSVDMIYMYDWCTERVFDNKKDAEYYI